MLNVEKYLGVIKSEIDENACASKSCLIAKVRRGKVKQDCDRITCRDCEDESIEWLFSEHEPQLLKNGDGLKPRPKIHVFWIICFLLFVLLYPLAYHFWEYLLGW